MQKESRMKEAMVFFILIMIVVVGLGISGSIIWMLFEIKPVLDACERGEPACLNLHCPGLSRTGVVRKEWPQQSFPDDCASSSIEETQ